MDREPENFETNRRTRLDKTKRRRRRLAQVTSAKEDKSGALLDEVRAGDLAHEELEMAAYLGHKVANQALGRVFAFPTQVHLWAAGLSRWGKGMMWLAGLHLARKCVSVAQQTHPDIRRDLRNIMSAGSSWGPPENVEKLASEVALRHAFNVHQYLAGRNIRHQPSHRSELAPVVVMCFGYLTASDEISPPDSFPFDDLWKPGIEGWRLFARLVHEAAWFVDNPGVGYGVYTQQPCRAAVLHVLSFLRSRMLTHERWK